MGKNKKPTQHDKMQAALDAFTKKYGVEFVADVQFKLPKRSEIFFKLFGKLFPITVERKVVLQKKSGTKK